MARKKILEDGMGKCGKSYKYIPPKRTIDCKYKRKPEDFPACVRIMSGEKNIIRVCLLDEYIIDKFNSFNQKLQLPKPKINPWWICDQYAGVDFIRLDQDMTNYMQLDHMSEYIKNHGYEIKRSGYKDNNEVFVNANIILSGKQKMELIYTPDEIRAIHELNNMQ